MHINDLEFEQVKRSIELSDGPVKYFFRELQERHKRELDELRDELEDERDAARYWEEDADRKYDYQMELEDRLADEREKVNRLETLLTELREKAKC